MKALVNAFERLHIVRGENSRGGKLAEYARKATFHTVMGAIEFGNNGEWSRPRVVLVRFQGIVGAGIEQFRDGSRQTIARSNDFNATLEAPSRGVNT